MDKKVEVWKVKPLIKPTNCYEILEITYKVLCSKFKFHAKLDESDISLVLMVVLLLWGNPRTLYPFELKVYILAIWIMMKISIKKLIMGSKIQSLKLMSRCAQQEFHVFVQMLCCWWANFRVSWTWSWTTITITK